MAWRYAEDHVQDGEVITPHELNKNVAVIVQETNGRLDRDNFMLNVVDATKLKRGATDAISFAALDPERGLELSRSANALGEGWMPIHTELELAILCVDGSLEVACNINYLNKNGAPLSSPGSVAIGLMVDDQLVAANDAQNFEDAFGGAPRETHQHVAADIPVGAGLHIVRPVIRLLESVSAVIIIEIDFGCCYARNVRR